MLKTQVFGCGENKRARFLAAGPQLPKPAAEEKPAVDWGPVCSACQVPFKLHPQTFNICSMLADVEAERDRLIEAIQKHKRSLMLAGLGESPDDLELFAALPVWVEKGAAE